MEKQVGLECVASHFPDQVVTKEDLAHLMDMVPPELKGIFKIPDQVRRLSHPDAAEILAEAVAKKTLEKAGLEPGDIDAIIGNNCGGRFAVPMVGSYVHWKGGYDHNITVFHLSNACASFVDACWMAWNFIRAGAYKRVLVVTVSAWDTPGGQVRMDLSDPFSYLMGDGAGAAIVSEQNLKCEFLAYHNRTFSEVYSLCGADNRYPLNPNHPLSANQPCKSSYLYGTPEFMQWWQEHGESFGIDGLKGAVKEAGMTLKDLDMIFMHQPADMLYVPWLKGAKAEGVPEEKWVHTWEKYGNLSNCVVPVNLAEFQQAGKLKKGDIHAWITIGAGGHAPTMVTRWLE